MVLCSILNCKSKSVKGGVTFFSFPKKESVAKEWLRYCRRTINTKYGKVCSIHFTPTDYFKSLRHILMNESPKIKKLKEDAVPSLHLNNINEPKIGLMKSAVFNQIVRTSDSLPQCHTKPNAKKSENSITISKAEHNFLTRESKQFNVLKNNLKKIFTPGQIRCLMKPAKPRVKWSTEDMAAAFLLKRKSPACYVYLKDTVGIPLPALSTLRRWQSRRSSRKVDENDWEAQSEAHSKVVEVIEAQSGQEKSVQYSLVITRLLPRIRVQRR